MPTPIKWVNVKHGEQRVVTASFPEENWQKPPCYLWSFACLGLSPSLFGFFLNIQRDFSDWKNWIIPYKTTLPRELLSKAFRGTSEGAAPPEAWQVRGDKIEVLLNWCLWEVKHPGLYTGRHWEERASWGCIIPRPATPAQQLLINYFTFILPRGTLHLSKHCHVLPLSSPSASFWVQTAHRIPKISWTITASNAGNCRQEEGPSTKEAGASELECRRINEIIQNLTWRWGAPLPLSSA